MISVDGKYWLTDLPYTKGSGKLVYVKCDVNTSVNCKIIYKTKYYVAYNGAQKHNGKHICKECYTTKIHYYSIYDLICFAYLKDGFCNSNIYIGAHKKYNWECKSGHMFDTTWTNILAGRWCAKCSVIERNKLKIINAANTFIDKAIKIHGDKFDYSQVEYKKAKIKVKIICNTCKNEWMQTPTNHLSGFGCPRCAQVEKSTIENFIKESNIIHNNFYIYDKSIYKSAFVKLTITCPFHGDFQQTPDNHKRGKGCPHCVYINEEIVREILNNLHIKYEYQFKPFKNKKYKCDFYLPDYNLIIEYNGAQHYMPVVFNTISQTKANENFIKQQQRDDLIRNYCKINNINLLEIDGRKYKGQKLKEFLVNFDYGFYNEKNK